MNRTSPLQLSFTLQELTIQYEACINGLEAALTLRIEEIEVFGDSALIICQTKGMSTMDGGFGTYIHGGI